MDFGFSDLVDAVAKVGTSTADVYKAWTGVSNEADEEAAYLKGQLAAMQANQKAQLEADTITIGDAKLSTSSIMWIIGGTLGLLAIGLGLKKMM